MPEYRTHSGESPHGGDFLLPGVQGFPQLDQLRQARLLQLVHCGEQAGNQEIALFAGAMFLQQ